MVSKCSVIKLFANILLPFKQFWGKVLITKSYMKTERNEIVYAIWFSLDFFLKSEMHEENDQKAIDQNKYSSCVSRLRLF